MSRLGRDSGPTGRHAEPSRRPGATLAAGLTTPDARLSHSANQRINSPSRSNRGATSTPASSLSPRSSPTPPIASATSSNVIPAAAHPVQSRAPRGESAAPRRAERRPLSGLDASSSMRTPWRRAAMTWPNSCASRLTTRTRAERRCAALRASSVSAPGNPRKIVALTANPPAVTATKDGVTPIETPETVPRGSRESLDCSVSSRMVTYRRPPRKL